MEDKFKKEELSKKDFDKICLSDIAQKWFIDTDFSDEFSEFMSILNNEFRAGNFDIDLDEMIEKGLDIIVLKKDTKKWQKRILTSAYLKYLANEKAEAQRLYSLYFDAESMHKMLVNIIRKSIYEYYVGLKYRIKEESETTSIFARNKNEIRREFNLDELDKIIKIIEDKWVSD